MCMQKSLLFLSIISASILFSAVALAQTEGSCTPQFLISSPESVSMTKTFVWVHIDVTNTGSCEGSTTVYPVLPEGWYWDNFTTKTLQAGESENSSIKIFTSDDSKSVTIQFLADGANSSQTKIVIGGMVPEEVANPPEQKNETQPPIIVPAANPAPISVPQETQPSVQQEPNETVAEQNQPAGSVTGLLTANPSAQIAVFAILLFGAGYLVATMKSEGFRYRFRR